MPENTRTGVGEKEETETGYDPCQTEGKKHSIRVIAVDAKHHIAVLIISSKLPPTILILYDSNHKAIFGADDTQEILFTRLNAALHELLFCSTRTR